MIDVVDVWERYQIKHGDKVVKEKEGRHKMVIQRSEQEKEYRETSVTAIIWSYALYTDRLIYK